jgi:hypothetical protein
MKLIKTASGKNQIKLSKSEWESIGKKAGWMKESEEDQHLLPMFKANLNNIISAAKDLLELEDESQLEGWIMDKISTAKDDINDVQHFYKDGEKDVENDLAEIEVESAKGSKKEMKDDPCWDGYEMVGKKEKDGKEVPNCVPKEASDELNLMRKAAEFDGLRVEAAEYQGKEVELNKPMRGDVKKYKVYVKNDKGNVVKVNFGDKGMEIKRDDPERRKSFRARHKCDQQKDKTKPAYWSCKMWSTKSVSDILKGK